jgi:hypothetical protein
VATLGKDVAAGLAERLGLDIVHHELVEHDIAERAGMRESTCCTMGQAIRLM